MKLTVVKLATKEVYRLDWDPESGQLGGDSELVAKITGMGEATEQDGYVLLHWLGTHTLKGSPLKDAQSLQWLLAMMGLGSPDLPPLPVQPGKGPDDVQVVY
jgi:hypothetical protein